MSAMLAATAQLFVGPHESMKTNACTLNRSLQRVLASSALVLAITNPCFAQITKPPQVRIFGTWWPAARDGFSSTGTYETSREAMWSFVLKALEDNRIAVASQDYEQGVIETAFLYPDAGRTVTNAIFQVRRFSYRFRITATGAAQAHIMIEPHVELASQVGWNRQPDALQWSDETGSVGYERILGVLRDWMYEQVEQSTH